MWCVMYTDRCSQPNDLPIHHKFYDNRKSAQEYADMMNQSDCWGSYHVVAIRVYS